MYSRTAIVATDNHVLNFELVNGEINNGHTIEVSLQDNIGNIAMHEHLTGHQAGDLIRRNAAIGAADPQIFGCLLLCQACKKTWVVFFDLGCPFPIVIKQGLNIVH